MNAKEAIAEIKSLLFNEDSKTEKFALVEGKLEDGTVVKYDLETADIFVVGADGTDVPAPVGEHKLETGEILVVETEGKIKEVKEVESPQEEANPQDMAKEDAPADAPAKDEPKEDTTKMADDLQNLTDKVAALEQVVAEMKKAHENMTEAVKLSADVIESLAKEPSAEPISKPNTFRSELKTEKENRINNLQSVFQKLKNK